MYVNVDSYMDITIKTIDDININKNTIFHMKRIFQTIELLHD